MELTDYKNLEKIANPYVVKCILLGDRGVGKSTMLHIFDTGRWDPTLQSTIGIDFSVKNITLPDHNNHKIRLQIWDTAGQEKFRSIVRSYLRGVYISFLMYDISDRMSWHNLVQWKEELESRSQYERIPLLVLVGTKSDLSSRVISDDEIKNRAREWGCRSYVISSKQKNSYSMISRIFSIAAENFHQLVIYKHINGKELPHGIYKDDNSYKLLQNKKNKCCFQ